MRQSRGVPKGSNGISIDEVWIISTFTCLPLVVSTIDSCCRLAAHHYCPPTMMATNGEGEQHCGPLSHDGLDEDDFYLDFLQQVTHYPDDYHHEPSAAVNTLPHVQYDLPLSRVGDAPLSAFAEIPLVEQRLSLGLSHYPQDMLEGAFVTEGPSPPPPPRETFYDDRDLFLTMVALGYSPEFPLSAHDQHAFSWGAPQPPLLEKSGQLCHLSIPQVPPQSPKANAMLKSCRIMDPSSGPSPSQNLNAFPCGPITEKAYDEAVGAYHSGSIQASTAAIHESPVDSSASTIHIDERLMYPTTFPQALWGHVDGFPEMSTNDHGSSLPYSVEEAASPNFLSTLQTSRPVITSSIPSNQVVPVDDISGTLWCPICGISFSQRQGLNRHYRDKHTPRNTCHLCGTYEWSPGRRYMFLRHLKRRHPEAVLA
ncbi:hypothetical protein EDB86DRAFT_1070294 [Lactarius hatsudake]|nr:hypothetical protein EDB86DRAFT_1070294 [Lactarius hatsudake]